MAKRRLLFTKMTGAGNDFVLIDNRRNVVKNPAQLARRLCDRRFGIGADGLLLLERSTNANYRMKYYNADGSSGGMCGNGGRCIARYAVVRRIAPRRHRFEALGHVYEADVRSTTVSLRMKDARNLRPDAEVELEGRRFRYHGIDTGAPHAVFLMPQPALGESLDRVDVETVGRALRYHATFGPAGTNVNFVERQGTSRLRMRTYERGVEAETQACGTGSIACAIAANVTWGMASPVAVTTSSRKRLIVRFERIAGEYMNIRLTGPAEITFAGTAYV